METILAAHWKTSSRAAITEDDACTLRANSNALGSQTKYWRLIMQYGKFFCCLAMVALIFAAAPAKAGDNSINVAVIVYDGVLTSDITAPLEVFGKAVRKPWLHKIKVEAVAADGDLDILTEEGIKLKADRLLAEAPRYDAVIVPSRYR